jgi:hypothetical protein
MTLKEKLEVIKNYDDQDPHETFMKIADDYAIDFIEWITSEKSKYSIMYGNQNKRFADFDKEYTSKELLEIFKKEKGL